MSNHNHTYVCASCKVSSRGRPSHTRTCSRCGETMTELCEKWRIPKKEDESGWKKLQLELNKNTALQLIVHKQ